MKLNATAIRVTALLLPIIIAACRCSGEGDGAGDADADVGCTYASCELECRAVGRCYGSCSGGRCGCSTWCGDGDVPDVRPDDGGREDGETDRFDVDDGGGDVTIVTRDGASPGVTCRKVPKPLGRTTPPATGLNSIVLHSGSDSASAWPPDVLTLFDWGSLEAVVLDDVSDVASAGTKLAWNSSLEGREVAYVRTWFTGATGVEITHNELRLLDLATGAIRPLLSNQGEVGRSPAIECVTLDYPWVTWRDVSEEGGYHWKAYALNVETGENIDLVGTEGSVIGIGLLDGIALLDQAKFTLVNLETGERRLIVDRQCIDMPGYQCDGRWGAVITPEWIAWMDSRLDPDCGWFSPCRTQIWGWNRRTETQVPLVTSDGMHGPMLAGRGDWLAWEDQRDDPDPYYESDRQQNIYALHLPTMTEVQVEDWPGFQFWPSLYPNGDEYHVLFYEEVGPMGVTDDLWDCALPVL
jgi:hypothetical protein